MKVKIGDKIYDSNDQPIAITLDKEEVEAVSGMGNGWRVYCSFPEGSDKEQIKEFMEEL